MQMVVRAHDRHELSSYMEEIPVGGYVSKFIMGRMFLNAEVGQIRLFS